MRAINSGIMKRLNRSMVLDCIRRNPISRASIADETQLTRASVTQIVDELMQDGLVVEHAAVSSKGPGRKQMLLALNRDALCIASVNLSCCSYTLGIMNLGGRVLYRDGGEMENRCPDEVLDEIAAKLKLAVAKLNPALRKIYAMGVTAPGPLDLEKGCIKNPPSMPCWHHAPVVEELRRRLGWDVYLGNISSAHAMDELYFGIGKDDVENFMVLTVGKTVGTGFVIGGRPFRSKPGFAPEIGHISLKRDGEPCACGNRGCFEQYIAFPQALRGTPFASWEEVVDQLNTDPAAAALLDRIASDLAFEIINISNVLYLDKVVLSGDYVYGGDRLAASINNKIEGRSLHELQGIRVVAASGMNMVRIAAMPAYHTLFAIE